jgi:Sodium:neurotransmitter symporter family
VGQYFRTSLFDQYFVVSKKFVGISIAMILVNIATVTYYIYIMAYSLDYLRIALTHSTLPWATYMPMDNNTTNYSNMA